AAPKCLKLAPVFVIGCGWITTSQPLFPGCLFVRIVIGTTVPKKFWRAEGRFVDEVPKHVVDLATAFWERRDELLLLFDRLRIEVSILTAPGLGQEREEREDYRNVVFVCGQEKRVESA